MTEGPPRPPPLIKKNLKPKMIILIYHEEPYNYQSQDDEDYQKWKEEYLNLEIKNIDDLIKIGEDYINGEYMIPIIKYNINVYKLSKLVKPLKKLQK